MYPYKIGLLPNVFKEMFSMTNQVHSYNTRNSNVFYLHPARTNIRPVFVILVFLLLFVCFVGGLFCLLFILIIFQYDFVAYFFIIFSPRLGRELT